MHVKRWTRIGLLAVATLLGCCGVLAGTVGQASAQGDSSWPVAGQNIQNTRDAVGETTISPANVAGLKVKWSLTTNGDVFDTPAVSNGVAYFTDHGGATSTAPSTLWAVNASTGAVIWSHSIPAYTGIAGDTSRSTPTIAGNLLILGDVPPPTNSGAYLFAVNASNGDLVWKTELNSASAADVTGSPVVYGNLAIVGTASLEQDLAPEPGYPCCVFTGNVTALNTTTGQILWQTQMEPSNGGKTGGYSGAGVWDSTPAIDPLTGMVYVGVGDNYTVPAGVCGEPDETGCSPPAANDYADSVVAMSLLTGTVTWHQRTVAADAYTEACTSGSNCGPDYDFGSGPNVYTTTTAQGVTETLVGAGQKSGVYYAFNPASGQIVWRTQIGPGTTLGGIEWGSATDGNRIYAAESDFYGTPYTVNGKMVTGGSWAALNAATGAIEWQTPDPQAAADLGFMSVANGVVYAPSDAGSGNNMYALNAATGAIDWSYASGGSVIAGAAIVNGVVYWGSGYYIGTANDKLYAFGL
jgi:polyvinyl alcohol dehydrogenase (cytochrome)